MKLGHVLTDSIFELENSIERWNNALAKLDSEIDHRQISKKIYEKHIASAQQALIILHDKANQ